MAENKINTADIRIDTAKLTQAAMVPPGVELAGPGAISAWVAGVPAPQGSKRGYARRGQGGKLHVSLVESSERVKPWREDIRAEFKDCDPGTFTGTRGPEPVIVKIVFVMPRPKATPKTKATPPHVKKPDLDKLIRAVLDALTSAGVYADDSQVVTVLAHKRLAELGEPTGAMIHVEPVQTGTEDLRACATDRGQGVPLTGSDQTNTVGSTTDGDGVCILRKSCGRSCYCRRLEGVSTIDIPDSLRLGS